MIARLAVLTALLGAGPVFADSLESEQVQAIIVERPYAVSIAYPPAPAPARGDQAGQRLNTVVRAGHTPDILAAARANGVNPRLLSAVIEVESASRVQALSPKGARGLMQIMPSTARSVGIADADRLFDPAVNVEAGARHLRALHAKFASLSLVLAAYNAGEMAVRRHGGVPPYPETTAYVARVLARFRAMGGRA